MNKNKEIDLRIKEDNAWELLQSTDLKLGQRMFIRSTFSDAYKNNYPFIGREYKKGNSEVFHSEIQEFKHLGFSNENEVILANAIFENIKESFNINDFRYQLKFTFQMLKIDSIWSR